MGYSQLAHTLTKDRPSLRQLLELVPRLSIRHRKALLDICRCQTRPLPNRTVTIRLKDVLKDSVYMPQGDRVTLVDLFNSVPELESALLSGFISMMVRSAPCTDEEEIEGIIDAGVEKELAAATGLYHPLAFDWSAIFHPSRRHRSTTALCPGYPIDGHLHDEVYHAIRRAMQKISSRPIYPDYSNRTLGRVASFNLSLLAPICWEIEIENTTLGLERLYHRCGAWVCGETEVRWSWKYGELKPRVYYARGPNQYYASRYIQTIFNTLVDSLPVTHRFERFFLNQELADAELLFIYDYESFTSRLHEVVNFVEALAVLGTGVQVTIVDTYGGPTIQDLGGMLREYNEMCQHSPLFDAARVTESPHEREYFLRHNCGMLGVPGNISSCTLLHGIHLSIILGTLKWKAVGDDAIGAGIVDSRRDLHSCLSNIGILSEAKMEYWKAVGDEGFDRDDTTWQYIKRPIDRVINQIFSKHQIVFPPVAILLDWMDKFHSVSRVESEYLRMKKVANMLLAFARQFQDRDLLEGEEQFVDRFLFIIRKKTGLDDYCDKVRVNLLYPYAIRSGQVVEDMIYDRWNQVVRLPEFLGASFQVPEVLTNREFIGGSTRGIKLAQDLGYAVTSPRLRSVIVRDYPEDVERFLSRDFRPTYDISLSYDTPGWLVALITEEYQSYVHDDFNDDSFGSLHTEDAEEDLLP